MKLPVLAIPLPPPESFLTKCSEADMLFEGFVSATKNHVMAANTLANLIGSKERFAEALLLATATYAECKEALLALEAHRKRHKCWKE